jgi:hypothetical protein
MEITAQSGSVLERPQQLAFLRIPAHIPGRQLHTAGEIGQIVDGLALGILRGQGVAVGLFVLVSYTVRLTDPDPVISLPSM